VLELAFCNVAGSDWKRYCIHMKLWHI